MAREKPTTKPKSKLTQKATEKRRSARRELGALATISKNVDRTERDAYR